MNQEFYLNLIIIHVNNGRIYDYSKIPQRFKNFLQSLDNIYDIQDYEYEGLTIVFSPTGKIEGDLKEYILNIYNHFIFTPAGRKKYKERLKPKYSHKTSHYIGPDINI